MTVGHTSTRSLSRSCKPGEDSVKNPPPFQAQQQELQIRVGDRADETNEEHIGWTGRARRQVGQQGDAQESRRGHVTGVLAQRPRRPSGDTFLPRYEKMFNQLHEGLSEKAASEGREWMQ